MDSLDRELSTGFGQGERPEESELVRWFSPAHTNLLRRVVQRISEKAGTPGTFEYYADDLRLQAEKVLTQMAATSS
jgi:hypothetical protein